MNRKKSFSVAALLAVFVLAGCGSSGGLGDILGGGGSGKGNNNSELRGTIDFVDASSRYVVLTNVSGYNNMLSNDGGRDGNTVRVYFDNQTQVEYQGKNYRPEDLERGDEVTVRVQESGNQLVAETMTVIRDASPNGSSTSTYPNNPNDTNGSTVRGTVRNVNTSARRIEIDRGYGNSTVTVDYDNNTFVRHNNQNYQVADLERGDEVDIRVRDIGSGRLQASEITVTRSISAGNGPGSGTNNQYGSTIRGTVRRVDTSRRQIELEQASFINNFNSGSSTGNRTFVVQYGSNTGVEVNGQMQAITGLERGDVVDVQVSNTTGSVLNATRITLVRDVNR